MKKKKRQKLVKTIGKSRREKSRRKFGLEYDLFYLVAESFSLDDAKTRKLLMKKAIWAAIARATKWA